MIDNNDIIMDKKLDKEQVYVILKYAFFICLIILILYSLKVSNDYNRLVIEYNALKYNISRQTCLQINPLNFTFGG